MRKFNLNECIYIQITKHGWKHLQDTVGDEYIKNCITTKTKTINNKIYYKLQMHEVFSLLPIKFGGPVLFNTNILFDDESLTELEKI